MNYIKLQQMIKSLIVVLLPVSLVVSCGGNEIYDKSGQAMINASGVYTLVNLHPDMGRSRLYAVNYQQAGLLPLCTGVTLLKANNKKLKFKVNNTGQVFTYIYHRSAVDPLAVHLNDYFGRECNTAKVKKLSAVDQKGIAEGVALKGMTRDGVTYAVGYPPKHKTPSLQSDSWKYWLNRFKTMDVEFGSDGRVKNIIND